MNSPIYLNELAWWQRIMSGGIVDEVIAGNNAVEKKDLSFFRPLRRYIKNPAIKNMKYTGSIKGIG